jgi:hypothetical protein
MNIEYKCNLDAIGLCWCVSSNTGQVCVRCVCRHIFNLDLHTISNVGMVSPSVVCPYKGCTFHEMVMLVGYGNHNNYEISNQLQKL